MVAKSFTNPHPTPPIPGAHYSVSLFCRNRAIADYLRSNGYEEAYSTFKKEAELDMVRFPSHNAPRSGSERPF